MSGYRQNRVTIKYRKTQNDNVRQPLLEQWIQDNCKDLIPPDNIRYYWDEAVISGTRHTSTSTPLTKVKVKKGVRHQDIWLSTPELREKDRYWTLHKFDDGDWEILPKVYSHGQRTKAADLRSAKRARAKENAREREITGTQTEAEKRKAAKRETERLERNEKAVRRDLRELEDPGDEEYEYKDPKNGKLVSGAGARGSYAQTTRDRSDRHYDEDDEDDRRSHGSRTQTTRDRSDRHYDEDDEDDRRSYSSRTRSTREPESRPFAYRDPRTNQVISIDPPPRGGDSHRPSSGRGSGRGETSDHRESQRGDSYIDPRIGKRVYVSPERGGRERDEGGVDRHGRPNKPESKGSLFSLPHRRHGGQRTHRCLTEQGITLAI